MKICQIDKPIYRNEWKCDEDIIATYSKQMNPIIEYGHEVGWWNLGHQHIWLQMQT